MHFYFCVLNLPSMQLCEIHTKKHYLDILNFYYHAIYLQVLISKELHQGETYRLTGDIAKAATV